MTTRALATPSTDPVAQESRAVIRLAMTSIVGLILSIITASPVVLVAAVVALTVHGALESPHLRRAYARRCERIQRMRSNEERERRLDSAEVATWDLRSLVHVVDDVVGTRAHGSADPLELEGLLDRYVDLAIAHHRCHAALVRADPTQLEARLAMPTTSPSHARVLERRLAHARWLAGRAVELEEAVAEVGQLIYYYGERAGVPEIDGLFDADPVSTVLERCDALDAVNRELSPGESNRT